MSRSPQRIVESKTSSIARNKKVDKHIKGLKCHHSSNKMKHQKKNSINYTSTTS